MVWQGRGQAGPQEVRGPFLSVSGAGRPPWRSYSRCTPSGTCTSTAPTRSAASNWTTGSWQVGPSGVWDPRTSAGSPCLPAPNLSCPSSASLPPQHPWHPHASPAPLLPIPSPVHPGPLSRASLCPGQARGCEGSALTHPASLHRAPGTADICDAALWWGWGKCAPGSRAGIAMGSQVSFPFPQTPPCLLVLVVLPDPADQRLSHNAPLLARSTLWTGVSSAHQYLLSVEPVPHT